MVEGVAGVRLDDITAGIAAVDHALTVDDARRVHGPGHRHAATRHVDRAADVHLGQILDTLGRQPVADLGVGHHRSGSVRECQLYRVGDVVEMAMGDQQGIDSGQFLDLCRTAGVVDPRIDQHHFAARQIAAQGRMAEIGELRSLFFAHRSLQSFGDTPVERFYRQRRRRRSGVPGHGLARQQVDTDRDGE